MRFRPSAPGSASTPAPVRAIAVRRAGLAGLLLLMAGVLEAQDAGATGAAGSASDPNPSLGPVLINTDAASPETAPVVRENVAFHTDITVVNPYDRAVRVKMLDATCSCAQLDLADHFLLPHGHTVLHVAVENANRSGPQDVHVSIYLSDPEFEPIEVAVLWTVLASVQVDAIPPGADPLPRPQDRAWQDIYHFVVQERPDEPQRLRKRIRLSCPAGQVPPGGLKVTGIDYPGTLWQFVPRQQSDGSWLVLAKANDKLATMPVGELHEQAVIHTNHPDKSAITLYFDSSITPEAGRAHQDPDAPPPAPVPALPVGPAPGPVVPAPAK